MDINYIVWKALVSKVQNKLFFFKITCRISWRICVINQSWIKLKTQRSAFLQKSLRNTGLQDTQRTIKCDLVDDVKSSLFYRWLGFKCLRWVELSKYFSKYNLVCVVIFFSLFPLFYTISYYDTILIMQ